MKFKELPRLIKLITHNYSAWIVGSAANEDSTLSTIRDIDVIVPFSDWAKVVILLPNNSIKNIYGGWRFEDDGIMVDIWPDDLGKFLISSLPISIWQPRYNFRFCRKN